MLRNDEPRCTAKCRRGSEKSFSGDISGYKPNHPELQLLKAAQIASRFAVSAELAKTIAELAYEKGRLR